MCLQIHIIVKIFAHMADFEHNVQQQTHTFTWQIFITSSIPGTGVNDGNSCFSGVYSQVWELSGHRLLLENVREKNPQTFKNISKV